MAASNPHQDEEMENDLLAEDDALEEIPSDDDLAMDSDGEEITLHNDSIAYFDHHKDSVFAIAQHPLFPTLIATGGSEGEADDAPGRAYVLDASVTSERPVLPASYNADPAAQTSQTTALAPLFAIDGHTDSISALAFTLPKGEFLVSAGLDGRIKAYAVEVGTGKPQFAFVGEAQEVPEVNWLAPCPSPEYPNTIALGASDGSVWVYTIDPSDLASPLQIVQSYFLHTESSTAGAWTPDGKLLATVSEDSSLYVWDVWGLAAAKGLTGDNGMTAVSLTGADQRFEVEGGLFSLAIEPRGAFLATGGVGGIVHVVSLPRLGDNSQPQKSSRGGNKQSNDPTAGGRILASLRTQSEPIEALAFSSPSSGPGNPATLLAAGSVDGSITVYDASNRFAVRRSIVGAHEEHTVVKVEFVPGTWLLTSAGMDGIVKRWDLRGGGQTGNAGGAADAGLVKEWKGHRGGGEGGGVLGFVQGQTGERVVTAGDDGIVLVFEA